MKNINKNAKTTKSMRMRYGGEYGLAVGNGVRNERN